MSATNLKPTSQRGRSIVFNKGNEFHLPSIIAILVSTIACSAQGFKTEVLFDPALNMKAYDVTVPAGWKYQGVLVPGSSCNESPTPVFRAYAPDGLTEFRRMPRFDWSWGNAPYNPRPQGDCLPLNHDVTAIAFAQHLAQLQKGENFTPGSLNPQFARIFRQGVDDDNAAIQARSGQRPFRGDAATATFTYLNGTFVIEEQLRVLIRCSHSTQPGLGGKQYFHEDCGADVRVLRAPQGKLASLISRIDNSITGAVPDARWSQAYNNERQRQTDQIVRGIQANTQEMLAQGREAGRVRQQQNQEFLAGQQGHYAEIRRQHDEQQGSYNIHNQRETAMMDARHTPASDVVDFALDQQTVSGTNGTVKVPANYSQVWANQSGQYFLTNDLNTNPNGVLDGSWTQQTQVHGNGRP